MKTLALQDFAYAFGAPDSELEEWCGDLIRGFDFRYRPCSLEETEAIMRSISRGCERGDFSVSGPHRKPDWVRGWNEILREFCDSGFDLKTLNPKDIRGDRPLRLRGEYVRSRSNSFEHDYSTVFRTWLFNKYFKNYENIYEFGCGTGHNLVLCAKLFPDKAFYGFDWAPPSQEILELIATHYHWSMVGYPFDFFQPDRDIRIRPHSIVYTSAALEQLGKQFEAFLEFLLIKRPSLCVNVECLEELYDRDSPFDQIALRYHRARNYLEGYLTRLRQLEMERKIKIFNVRRLYFGSLYHEVYSFVIWKPL